MVIIWEDNPEKGLACALSCLAFALKGMKGLNAEEILAKQKTLYSETMKDLRPSILQLVNVKKTNFSIAWPGKKTQTVDKLTIFTLCYRLSLEEFNGQTIEKLSYMAGNLDKQITKKAVEALGTAYIPDSILEAAKTKAEKADKKNVPTAPVTKIKEPKTNTDGKIGKEQVEEAKDADDDCI